MRCVSEERDRGKAVDASEEKARDCVCGVSAVHQGVLLSRRLVLVRPIRMVSRETDGTLYRILETVSALVL